MPRTPGGSASAPSGAGEGAAHQFVESRRGWRGRERLLQPGERVCIARESRTSRRQPAPPIFTLELPQLAAPHGARGAVVDERMRQEPYEGGTAVSAVAKSTYCAVA
jgi:hypothetical protein